MIPFMNGSPEEDPRATGRGQAPSDVLEQEIPLTL
jgi:hypothetical protein